MANFLTDVNRLIDESLVQNLSLLELSVCSNIQSCLSVP